MTQTDGLLFNPHTYDPQHFDTETRRLLRATIDFFEGLGKKRILDDDLSAGALAARAGVSERHLTRLFLREVGLTPGRFVRRARTAAAAQLLTTTDLTVEAIANRCGFGAPETLRQAFQAQYGVSPTHYRATQSGSGLAHAR